MSVFVDSVLVSISIVLEATHEASRGPEKGAVSAQKGLLGSETETRELLGGTEEKSVSPRRETPRGKAMIFYLSCHISPVRGCA